MKLIPRCFLVFCLLLAGCIPAPATPPIEPDAGSWQTWVVTDVAAVRPPSPPDQAATRAELQEVQAAVAARDEVALQQIAYWDGGPPSYRWIETALNQLRSKPTSGPRTTRMMALLNVAIYDAMVAAWDAKYTYNRPRPGTLDPRLAVLAQHTNSPSYPSEQAVAAGAAAAILGYLYPDQAQEFVDKAQAAADSRVAAGAAFPSDVAAGLALGKAVAEQVIVRAQIDDALPAWDGVIPTGNGYWTGEKPVEPNAAKWQPWVLASNDELRSPPPPAYDSPVMVADLQEVKTFTRTFATNQKGMWWQALDGVVESWYTFASLRMFESGLDANPVRAARIYAMMAVAQYDAGIAIWDAKYTYWTFRPFQMDPSVTTVFPTPNYPSYPSGHAGVTNAMAEVLAYEFPAYADLIRARAAEAYESRIWDGIHFRFEMVEGKRIGVEVAKKVIVWDQQDGAMDE